MLEFQLLVGAVSFFGLALIALGQPPAPRGVRVRSDRDALGGDRGRRGRW